MKICNWGNYPVFDANVQEFDLENSLYDTLVNKNPLIARGLGRCYGDSALGENVLSTLKFNRFLSFDDKSGSLCCEAGVSFAEILDAFVPRGWFPPVTPGTKFVTIGGAIASDVHGKNHHIAGSISNHVFSMEIMLASGKIISCSQLDNSDLFWATCGGMGMTGIILRVTLKLVRISSAYIVEEKVKAKNLDHVMEIFEESVNWTYTVAWIDCLAKDDRLGRSILMRGEHATANECSEYCIQQKVSSPLDLYSKKKRNIPFFLPNFILNEMSVKTFNYLYYNKLPKGIHKKIVDYDQFFYPLDAILNWNRIYGKRGFTQYQFVLPLENSKEGLKKILKRISAAGFGSFLAVLKLFGKQSNLISFPTQGYTLALDFPISERLFPFLETLDKIVLDSGGRLYLTKDVRMSETMFKASYANSENFLNLKRKFDPNHKFQSLQSKRLGI